MPLPTRARLRVRRRLTAFTSLKPSALLASAHEIAENPRARSARLRIARKVSP